jgi:segregation and condensation protein B
MPRASQPQPTPGEPLPESPAGEPLPDSPEALSRSLESLLEHQPAWESSGSASESVWVGEQGAPRSPPPVVHVIEAMLFVGGSPLTSERAGAALRGLTPEQFKQAVDALNHEYRRQGRPYLIQSRDQGYLLTLRPRFLPIGERLYGQARQARLSPAAIDVLALVAYRQPIAKQEIDSIRGMESGALLRQLVRRNLVAVVQRGEAGHREVCYGTTQRFLELFRLGSLADLPQTQDLQKL